MCTLNKTDQVRVVYNETYVVLHKKSQHFTVFFYVTTENTTKKNNKVNIDLQLIQLYNSIVNRIKFTAP